MVYGSDATILVEINMPMWRWDQFVEADNWASHESSANLPKEVKEITHTHEFEKKERNGKVLQHQRPIRIKECDLVLKKVVDQTKKGKLYPNWEGPYQVR